MITLAVDTSEARGSVAVLREGLTAVTSVHRDGSDYSAWLLPAVKAVLTEAGIKMESLDLLAVCSGPGSFTGMRVGLTAVKAWAVVYGKRIVGVSRLDAIVRSYMVDSPFAVACYNAQRGQLFAALYRNTRHLERLGEEMVISPAEMVSLAAKEVNGQQVTWVCLDPDLVRNAEGIGARMTAGDEIVCCSAQLASQIGILGEEKAAKGLFSDASILDANYVRRSDAEIFWKDRPPVWAEASEADRAFRVARCQREDLGGIAAILSVCPEAAAWSKVSLQGILEERRGSILLAWQAEEIKGFVVGRRSSDEIEILNLAVIPGARHCGIGRALVEELLRTLAPRNEPIKVFLEVRESNSGAVAFYRGLGFEQIGRREGYYRDPTEAALALSLSLSCTA